MNPQLRLVTRSGAELLARLVFHGDAYGPGGRLVNGGRETLVEFARPRLAGDVVVGDYTLERLAGVRPGWHPGDSEALALDARQVERLRRWLASPATVEDAVVVLVGDDEVLRKVAVALAPLGLEPRYTTNGAAALDSLRRLPPQLAVVGEEVVQLDPLALVRRVAAAPETRDVPVVVLGGDRATALAAGAALHLSLPLDHQALVRGAADLLELV